MIVFNFFLINQILIGIFHHQKGSGLSRGSNVMRTINPAPVFITGTWEQHNLP